MDNPLELLIELVEPAVTIVNIEGKYEITHTMYKVLWKLLNYLLEQVHFYLVRFY